MKRIGRIVLKYAMWLAFSLLLCGLSFAGAALVESVLTG
jgi:hypothetical protein